MANYRDRLGLRSDDAWVDSIESSDVPVDPVWGIRLGESESEALRHRHAVQVAADPLLASLSEDDRRDLASAYFDTDPEGTLVLKFVRDVDARRDRLKNAFKYPESLRVEFAANSIESLDMLIDSIRDATAQLDVYVPFISRDDFNNQVVVEVQDDPNRVRAHLRRTIGAGPYVVVETDQTPSPSDHPGTEAQYENPPPMGGQRISRPDRDEPGSFFLCSSAFYGQRAGTLVQDVLVTAGHCTSATTGASTSDAWSLGFPGVYQLGFTLDSSFENNGDTDSALIVIGNGTARPEVANINNSAHHAIASTGNRGDAFDIANANVCVSGFPFEGNDSPLWYCTVIESTNVTVNYAEESTTLLRVRRTVGGFGFRGGASGGAIVSITEGSEYTNPLRIFSRGYSRAVGILSGGVGPLDNPSQGLYTHIREATDELDLVIRLDPIDRVP